jgi:hypothetical protein
MPLVVFDRDWTDRKPEEPGGKWVILCPKCSVEHWRGPGCDQCDNGWVIIDAIETQPACKIEDHTYRIEFDAGSFHITCVDPHPRDVQEAMMRHDNFRSIPGCLEDGELRDMMAGTIEAKFAIVVEGGSYEYPNDVDVWYEITEAKLVD